MKSDVRGAAKCLPAHVAATWKSNARAVTGLTFVRAPLSALLLSAGERPYKRALMLLLLKDRLRAEGQKNYITDDKGVVIGFGDEAYHVKEIPSKLARETIRANHYSKTIVNNSYVNLGVYWRGVFVGCLQFGYAMNPNSGRRVVAGTENRQYLELNRMWVADVVPANGESMAIAYAIRFIRARYPGVQWIQSFADERCGRWGVVYQAANFQYLGHHLTDFWLLDGEWYHDLLVTAHKKGGGRGHFLRENLHRAERRRFRQFRYIRFLDRAARKRLLKPIVPDYPKPEAPT
jgi:adenine modification enzyme